MADVQIDNVVRAQAIWKGASGLPEDLYVTTWHFVRSTGGVESAADQSSEVSERLREWWLEPVAPNARCPADFIPSAITGRGLTIRTYDLGQPAGTSSGSVPDRIPTIYNFPTTKGSAANALPEEVAVTNSFFATRNSPRTRGRVFVGPLTVEAVELVAGVARVSAECRKVLIDNTKRLAIEQGVGDSMNFGVLSPTDGEVRAVTNGWVDNAFDTIRSRGTKASLRNTWS